jgi:hypothetical protein
MLAEITEDGRFAGEADRVFDSVEQRVLGDWCLAHRHLEPRVPARADSDVCVADSCTADDRQRGGRPR